VLVRDGATVATSQDIFLEAAAQTITLSFMAVSTSHTITIAHTNPAANDLSLMVIQTGTGFFCTGAFNNTVDIDTDGDGKPNRFDLDSDGDGCSDAFEGGATRVKSDSLMTAPFGANGFANNKETTTESGVINYTNIYNSFAKSASLVACIDSDNDGIEDVYDIDDDNDGIPDDRECVISSAKNRAISTFTINSYFTQRTGCAGNGDQLWNSNNPFYRIGAPNDLCIAINGNNITDYATGSLSNGTILAVNGGGSTNGFREVFSFIETVAANRNYTIKMPYFNWGCGGQIIVKINGNVVYLSSSQSSPNFGEWSAENISWYSGSTTSMNVSVEVYDNGASCHDYMFDDFSIFSESQSCDADEDGVPNRLDLDSDGDGCFDAFEAGASLVTTDSIIAGPYGANGLANSKETFTDNGVLNYVSNYNTYAISSNIATCRDFDADGVLDINDIDDDNDGTIDALESPSCFFAASNWFSGSRNQIVSSTSLPMHATYNRLVQLADGDNGTAVANYAVSFIATTAAAKTVYAFDMSVPVEITKLFLGYVNTNTHFNAGTFLKLQGSNDNATWINLNDSSAYNTTVATNGVTSIFGITGTVNANVFPVTRNPGKYRYYRIFWTNGGGINVNGFSNEIYIENPTNYVASLNPSTTCNNDIDSDGKFNHLDLDSDGDGCSDAKEAGATTSATANFKFTGTMGNNGLDNALETVADNGNINYTSYYSNAIDTTKNGCRDFDGDGIGDLIDIDDDNDGILDDAECPSFSESKTCNNWISPTNGATGTIVSNTGEVVSYSITANSGVTYRSLVGADFWTTTMQCSQPLPGSGNLANIVGTGEFTITFNRPVSNVQILTSATETGVNEGIVVTTNAITQQNVSSNCNSANQSVINNSVNQSTVVMTGDYAVLRSVKDAPYTTLNVKGLNNTGGFILSVSLCSINTLFTCDTDNDGISNMLDLDSDGDGCGDAFEAGATSVRTDSIIAGPYGINGYANSKETGVDNGISNYNITYRSYALSNTISLCKDTDGDGVLDFNDIDDDNDGSLDALESPSCFFAASDWFSDSRPHIVASTSLAMNTTYNRLDLLEDGDNSVATVASYAVIFNATTVAQATVYSFDMSVPVEITKLYLGYVNANTHFNANTFLKLQGSNDNSNWINLSDSAAYNTTVATNGVTSIFGLTGTINANVFPVTKNSGRYRYYRVYWTNGGGINSNGVTNEVYFETPTNYNQNLNPKLSCEADSDLDGIYNHLDLDSDNDGCSDAKEAGATTSTTANFKFAGTMGTNGLANSLETVADNGTINYASYYDFATDSLKNGCLDFDNDGISDIIDIDDDNDGILDVNESACPVPWTEPVVRNVNGTTTGILSSKVTASVLTYGLMENTNGYSITYDKGFTEAKLLLGSIDPSTEISFYARLLDSTLVGPLDFTIFNNKSPLWVPKWSVAGFPVNDVNFAVLATKATGAPFAAGVPYIRTPSSTSKGWGGVNLIIPGATATNPVYQLVLDVNPGGALAFSLAVETINNISNIFCKDVDLDGDGFLNYLDRDSDGDGCTDAFEAGATTVNTDSIIAGPYGANGYANSKETSVDNGIVNYPSTYSSFALSATVGMCKDNDGDGSPDYNDIDDDNDGVLDATESPSCFYNASEWFRGDRTQISATTGLIMNTTYNRLNKLEDGDNGTAVASYAVQFNATTTAPASVYTFDMSVPVEITKLNLGYVNTNTHFNANTFLKLQGSNDNTIWTNLSDSAAYSTTIATNGVTSIFGLSGTINANVFPVTRNSGRYRYYRIYWTNGGGINTNGLSNEVYFETPTNYQASQNPKLTCKEDKDLDGTLNHLDLDSDGDGCSDAKEAGATTSATANYKFTGAMGANGLVNSLETATDNGTINYTSYYQNAIDNTKNGCLDSDNDSIGDLIDIDDDNDGVLDATEIMCENTNINSLTCDDVVAYTATNFTSVSNNTAFGTNTLSSGEAVTITYSGTAQSIQPAQMSLNSEYCPPTSNEIVMFYSGAQTHTIKFSKSVINPIISIWSLGAPSVAITYTFPMPIKILKSNGALTQNSSTVITGAEGDGSILIAGIYDSITFVANTSEIWTGLQVMLGKSAFIAGSNSGSNSSCQDIDTDGDGIPNRLDRDSDGDGCSDALESGATTSTVANFSFAAPHGANGLVDSRETAVDNGTINYASNYASYAMTSNIATCKDSDNDGVLDINDIDDDNDGILDATESPSCFFSASEWLSGNRAHITANTSLTMNGTYSRLNLLDDGDNGTAVANYAVQFNASTTALQTVYNFDMSIPVEISKLYLGYINTNTHFNANTFLKLQGSNDNVLWTNLSDSLAYNTTVATNGVTSIFGLTGTINANVFSVTRNAGRYRYYRIYWTNGGGINVNGISNEAYFELPSNYNQNLNPKATCGQDADNDGKLNHQDLDSDGDGCSDAKEAGSSTSTVSDFKFTGTMGTNGLDNSLETSVDNGTINYTVYYNNAINTRLNGCTDTDGDGIGDLIDIDDDNDGVIDDMEIGTCSVEPVCTTFPANNSFAITSTGCLGWTSINGNFDFMQPFNGKPLFDHQGSANPLYGMMRKTYRTISNVGYSFTVGLQSGQFMVNDGVTPILRAVNAVNGTTISTLNLNFASNTTINFTAVSDSTRIEVGYPTAASTNIGSIFWYPLDLIVTSNCGDIDTDGDSIPNRLDRDSDGDGCSDALESGATTSTTANFAFAGPYGVNGLADAKETSVDNGIINYGSNYAPYALSANIAACRDADGDGIMDFADVDDDNDGVLDATESPSCFYNASEWLSGNRPHIVPSSGLAMNATYNRLNLLDDGNNATAVANYAVQFNATTTAPAVVYAFDMNVPVEINRLYLGYINTNTHFNANTFLRLQGSNDNVAWTNLNDSFAYSTTTATNGAASVPGVAGTNNANIFPVTRNAGRYRYYRILWSSGGGINTNGISNEVYFETPSTYNVNLNPKATCTEDGDKDKKFNHLDTDSDNDGCSDALESGATSSTTANFTFAAPYGTNGLADSKETSADNGIVNYVVTYEPYATSTNLAICRDSDNDGVSDLFDIDDDNDGIIDAIESPSCFYSSAEWLSGDRNVILASSNLNMNPTYANPSKLEDGDNGTGVASYAVNFTATTAAPAVVYTFTMPVPVELGRIYLGYVNTNTHFNAGTFLKLQGSNNNTTWTDLCDSIAYNTTVTIMGVTAIPGVTGTNNANIFPVNKNQGSYKYYRVYWTNGGGINVNGISNEVYFETAATYVPSLNPKPGCSVDKDNDGIFNHLDLDSDGDGCSDALEGNATSSKTANFTFPAPHGTNGLANTLETQPDNGTINYTSTYSSYANNNTIKVCLDSDGDGLADYLDIDDDNDGVLDISEDVDCQSNSNYSIDIAIDNGTSVFGNCAGSIDGPGVNFWGFNLAPFTGSRYMGFHHTESMSVAIPSSTPITPGTPYKVSVATANASINAWNSNFPARMDVFAGTASCGTAQLIGSTTLLPAPGNVGSVTAWEQDDLVFTPNAAYTHLTFIAREAVTGSGNRGYLLVDGLNVGEYVTPEKCTALNDTDNDGIPNRLDTDSDGDGCSDAYEAGATTSTAANFTFTGPFGNNGLVNSKEIVADNGIINYSSTYSFYGLDKKINACADTDGDGVRDVIDIDDDNDGIPDIEEMDCASFTTTSCLAFNPSYAGANLVVNGGFENGNTGFTSSYTHTPGGSVGCADYYLAPTGWVTAAGSCSGSNAMQLNADCSANQVSFWCQEINVSPNTNYKFGFSMRHNAISYIAYSVDNGPLSTPVPTTANWSSQEYIINSGSKTRIKICLFETSKVGGGADFGIDDIYFVNENALTCNKDIDSDNDGIPNRLDLDSDNDGCSDAYEGGSTTSTTANYKFTGTMGTNGLDNSKETAVDNGIINYILLYENYAKDSTIKSCLDTDGDGVKDIDDIDDDNDGIPDDLECPRPSIALNGSFEANVGSNDAHNGTAGANWTNVTGSPDLWISPMPTTGSGVWGGLADGMPPSPNGGNFVAAGDWVQGGESFSQTISGLLIGQEYEISLFYANAGVQGNTSIGAAGSVALDVHINLNGVLSEVFTTPLIPYLGEGNQIWYQFKKTFIATATSHTFQFSADNGLAGEPVGVATNYKYVAMDGFELKRSLKSIACDTDGDGKPNYLDLDSDGDGCSDAFETGSTLNFSDSIIAGPYGVNGLANSKEFAVDSGAINYIATYSNATNSAIKKCLIPDFSGNNGIEGNVLNLCQQNGGTRQLVATPTPANSGAVIKWYTVPTGGTASTTAPTVSLTNTGTISYWASQTLNGTEGPRAEIIVRVNAFPSAPTSILGLTSVDSNSINVHSVTAVANATGYIWTLPSGWRGTSTTNYITDTAGSSGGVIYVKATNNGCSSDSVTLNVNVKSAKPNISNNKTVYCQNDTAVQLTATGTNLKWYTSPTAATFTTTAPIPSTAVAGTYSYFVSQTVNGNVSDRAEIIITVNPIPAQPGAIVGPTAANVGDTVKYFVTGASVDSGFVWTKPSTWTILSTNTNKDTIRFIVGTPNAGEVTVVKKDTNSCSSLAQKITIKPAGPNTNGNTGLVNDTIKYCQGATATQLTASLNPINNGGKILWYTSQTGGTGDTMAPTPSTVSAVTTTYWVGQTVNGVESDRSKIVVVINPSANQPNPIVGSTTVTSNTSYTYSVTAVVGATSYTWTKPNGWTGTSTTNSITLLTDTTSKDTITVTANIGTCSSASQKLIISLIPQNPTAVDSVVYCQNTTATQLTASLNPANNGGKLKWYTAVTGGTGDTTAPTPSTLNAGTTFYYVSQMVNGAESGRTPVKVIVNPSLNQPNAIVGPNAVLANTAYTYSVGAVSGATSYTWTKPNGWTGTSTTNTINVTTDTSTTGTISVVANGTTCSSVAQTLTITKMPDNPSSGLTGDSIVYCQGATASQLTASLNPTNNGGKLKWYTSSTGGVGDTISPTPSTLVASTTYYYVSQTVNGVESGRTAIKVVVKAAPNQPNAIVGASAVSANTAYTYSITAVTGATSYTWTKPNGWTGTSTTNTLNITTDTTTSGTVTVVANIGSCSSLPQTLTISALPLSPSSGVAGDSIVYCQGATASQLTASLNPANNGGTLNWYTTPTGGASSATAPTPSTTFAGTTFYYVSQTVNGIESSRTAIKVVVRPTPSQPTSIQGTIAVSSNTSYTYSVSAVPGATSYTWTKPNGWSGTSTTNSITLLTDTSSGVITVTANLNNCSSVAQTLTVSQMPNNPASGVVGDSVVYCQGATATQLTANLNPSNNGGKLKWHTSPTGGIGDTIAPTPATLFAGTTYYYVSQTVNGIESGRTPIKVIVKPVPNQPNSISGPTAVSANTNYTYNIGSVLGATSYTWTLPNGWTGTSTTNSISINTSTTTSGIVTVKANLGGCSSAAQILNIGGAPSEPDLSGNTNLVGDSIVYCQNATATQLTANLNPANNGGTLNWYTSPTGGTASATAPTPSTSTAGTSFLYVSQTVNGVESARKAIKIVVKPAPNQPNSISGPSSVSANTSYVYSISAVSGATSYTWTLPNGWTGTSNTTSISVTTDTITSGVVFVTANVGSCNSIAQSKVVGTLPNNPTTNMIGDSIVYCQGATASQLAASLSPSNNGGTLNWYTVASGGTASTSAPTPSTLTAGTTLYYVSQTVGGVESNRTTIKVVVKPVPAQASLTTTQPTCAVNTATITVNAPLSGAYKYSVDSINYSLITTFSNLASGSRKVYVKDTTTGCTSSIATTINAAPAAPTNPTVQLTQPSCQSATGSIVISAPTGSNYIYSIDSINYQSNPTFNGVTAGTYRVRVKDITANCATDTGTKVVINSFSGTPNQPGTITGPVNPTIGSTVTYSIDTVAGASSYTWTVPTGWSISSGQNTKSVSVVVGSTGGTITVKANNNSGCSSAAQTLDVNKLPAKPIIDPANSNIVGNTITYCQGTVASPLRADSTVSGAMIKWYTGTDSTSASNAGAIDTGSVGPIPSTAVGNTQTMYWVSQTVNGEEGIKALIIVKVNPTPSQPNSIVGNAVVLAGSTQIYSVNAVPGATSYTWTLPSGWSGTSTTNSITSTVGTLGGIIKVKANLGNCSSQEQTLTVNIKPSSPDITSNTGISGNTITYCQGATPNQLSATGISGSTLKWYDSDGTTVLASAPTPSTEFVQIKTYYVSQIVNGVESDKVAINVKVNSAPAQPNPIQGDTLVTKGSTKTYTVAAVPGATSYTWTLPNGWTGTSTTNSITVVADSVGGIITVKANSTNCSSPIQTLTVNVKTNTNNDADGDGIPDDIEKGGGSSPKDTDGDGIPDYQDPDSDNDGIPDSEEDSGCTGVSPCNPTDTDGDGNPDYTDTDSDNDGITDNTEKGGGTSPKDTDGDGIPDYRDPDSDGDGIPDSIEKGSGTTPKDTDGDGIPDYLDPDSDNDGIPDNQEDSGCTGTSPCTPTDSDGDGIPDYIDTDSDNDGIKDSVEDSGCNGVFPCNPTDTDGDGIPDYRDPDSDGDGIPDSIEKGSGTSPRDSDGDGIPDYLDPDSDGDGIPDANEDSGCTGIAPCTPTDTDSDGMPDYLDLDSDGDGIPDAIEDTGCNGTVPCNPSDKDNDGIPNYKDLDSDGDGIPDSVEKGNGTTPQDSDGDGIPNYLDLDSDNDGILDAYENQVCPTAVVLCDTDGDGIPNYIDLDSDGDGKSDVSEAKGTDANNDGKADGTINSDGVPSSAGGGLTPPDANNDGKTDPYDIAGTIDTDGDGIPDAVEKGNGTTPQDSDGDGIPNYLDLDSDNDGILDAYENNVCVPSVVLCDIDSDGIPNYMDLDSDNDGIPDVIESNGKDDNGDGKADGASNSKGIPSSANNGNTPPNTDSLGYTDPYELDSDNDGILDSVEKGSNGSKPRDSDGDGTPDYRDLDSDGDGIPDQEEGQLEDCDKDGTVDYLDPDNCDGELPNYISPNGDGTNEKFVIPSSIRKKYPNLRLSIYNRWGNMVWRSNGVYQNNWGGEHFDESNLPDGVYYYILELETIVEKNKTGFIQVMRH
jgi:gliding motility-associated-like protein